GRVGGGNIERRAGRLIGRQRPVVQARNAALAGLLVRDWRAREDGLPERVLVDRLGDRLANDRILECRIALAGALAALVQIEVLVLPAGADERLADVRIDVLDRRVI